MEAKTSFLLITKQTFEHLDFLIQKHRVRQIKFPLYWQDCTTTESPQTGLEATLEKAIHSQGEGERKGIDNTCSISPSKVTNPVSHPLWYGVNEEEKGQECYAIRISPMWKEISGIWKKLIPALPYS